MVSFFDFCDIENIHYKLFDCFDTLETNGMAIKLIKENIIKWNRVVSRHDGPSKISCPRSPGGEVNSDVTKRHRADKKSILFAQVRPADCALRPAPHALPARLERASERARARGRASGTAEGRARRRGGRAVG